MRNLIIGILIKTRISSSTLTIKDVAPLFVYPNPSNGTIFIDGNEKNCRFKLYDTYGQLLKSGNISNSKITIDSKGVFILYIINSFSKIRTIKKIIIK